VTTGPASPGLRPGKGHGQHLWAGGHHSQRPKALCATPQSLVSPSAAPAGTKSGPEAPGANRGVQDPPLCYRCGRTHAQAWVDLQPNQRRHWCAASLDSIVSILYISLPLLVGLGVIPDDTFSYAAPCGAVPSILLHLNRPRCPCALLRA